MTVLTGMVITASCFEGKISNRDHPLKATPATENNHRRRRHCEAKPLQNTKEIQILIGFAVAILWKIRKPAKKAPLITKTFLCIIPNLQQIASAVPCLYLMT
jgi:hypothetical protein